MQHVIKVNGAVWNIVSKGKKSYMVERLGQVARLFWHSATCGKMVSRNLVNGKFQSVHFRNA
jgi:hypothetical protein